MAGDWVKMRASLCTNPKVLLIADIIAESTEVGRKLTTGFNGALDEIVTSDVTRDITLASLLRVWCATNEHTRDGVWHNSTLRTIDQAAGVPGFGEAMQIAGWAIYDAEKQTVTLPNFLENNAPAKGNARSSAAERQAKYRQRMREKSPESDAFRDVTRDITRDVTSNAREEKRREDISPVTNVTGEGREKSKRATRRCPDEFELSDAMQAWASEHAPAVDIALATAKFRDHTFRTAISDWPAAWRNWLRRDQEAASARKQQRVPYQTASDKRKAFAEALTGGPSHDRDVIDIN